MIILIAAAVMAANLKPELLNARPVVSTDDYPARALRAMEQGTTAVRITVDAAGTPAKCNVVQSSSSADLDDHTCALYMRRAHFRPATNAEGIAIEGIFDARASWTLHQSAPPQN